MNYLLDTSALKWAYIKGSKHCRRCRYIMSRAHGRVYIAEITILEIVSAFGHEVRGGRMSAAQFAKLDRQFLKDIAVGRLSVARLLSSDLVGCRQLLALVGVAESRALESQDAMVAYTARRLALESAMPTRVLTSDRRLARIIQEVTAFSGLVTSEYLHPK